MEPLFVAVAHGCQASLYEDAYKDVYRRRIMRGDEYYCTRNLGAIGEELGVVACFFDKPWSQPTSLLDQEDRSWLWRSAGFLLRAQGQLKEAIDSMDAGLISSQNTNAEAAGYLCEMSLLMTSFSNAIRYADLAVSLADAGFSTEEKEQPFWQIISRTQQAHAYHVMGKPGAMALFLEAERIKQKFDEEHPLLNSSRDFITVASC